MRNAISRLRKFPDCAEHIDPRTCAYIYPIAIFDVDISFPVNKEFDYFSTGFFNCDMEGSHLMERDKAGH